MAWQSGMTRPTVLWSGTPSPFPQVLRRVSVVVDLDRLGVVGHGPIEVTLPQIASVNSGVLSQSEIQPPNKRPQTGHKVLGAGALPNFEHQAAVVGTRGASATLAFPIG
jgi:hypothetical protein